VSRALLVRSLIGMAECPYCRTTVYLGDCLPREEIVELRVEEQPDPVGAAMPRWWECAHLPADRGHRWQTAGPIELRPVLALHVTVVPTADQLTAEILQALRHQHLEPIPELLRRLHLIDPARGRALLDEFAQCTARHRPPEPPPPEADHHR
jgi:hypothetical protein